jgi:hypothetical protein
MPRGGWRIGHALAVVAGAAAGLLLVLLVFFRVEWSGGPALAARFDLGGFVRRLPEHRSWLLPFALLAATLPAWRALVWRAVAPPPAPAFADAYHATAVGALVHNAVPGKLGPAAAAWILARFTGRPFTPLFSSQLVAKLLELGVVVAVAAAAAAARPGGGLGAIALTGAALFAAFAAAALAVERLAPGVAARLAARFPRAAEVVVALGIGVRGAGSAGRLGLALAAAAAPVLTCAVAYGVALHGVGVAGWRTGGAIVLALLTFGQMTPGLPVGAGVYWSLAAWGARSLGASAEDAAALAVLSHAAMVVTNLAVGGVSALVRRGALRGVLRRRESRAAA